MLNLVGFDSMNRTWIGTLILVVISGASASSKPECRPPEVSDGTADGVIYLASKDDCFQVDEVDESSWEELQIFCHNGTQPTLASFWSSVTMKLKIDSDDYHIYLAPNVSMVQLAHKDFKASWFYSTMPWKSKDMKINPFQSSCMGVLARDKYTVRLHTYRVNYWQVFMTIVGVLIFFSAYRLCRNVFFHYSTGVMAGVLFSLLVITYFIQKRVRTGFFGWILGFYSLSLYLMSSLWYNLKTYVVENQTYVLGYFLATGILSFAICYRMGPVENPRTLNLIQWSLQLFALILIYLSSYHQVASMSVAILVLTWAAIPDYWKTQAQVQYRKRFFKPKVKLLTESEYLDQSRIETERALNELRSFCQSPKCNAWKTVSQLQSPSRFAEFIEGSSHLTQDEVMNYSQATFEDGDLTDDSPEMTDDESSDELNANMIAKSTRKLVKSELSFDKIAKDSIRKGSGEFKD